MPPLVVSLLLCLLAAAAPAASAARAFFVFSDSLVDNGNNNYLLTTARADAPPYGIDFPTHRATDRFSNGLNIPDIISNIYRTPLPIDRSSILQRNDVSAYAHPCVLLCYYCTDTLAFQASTSGPNLCCRT